MPSPEREPSVNRRVVLGLSSGALASLAGCAALPDCFREDGPGRTEPDRRVATDWHPEPGRWPMEGYNYARTNHNPFASPPRSDPEAAWTYDTEDGGDVNTLVVVDDAVFVRTDTALVALDATDGRERWRRGRETTGGLWFVAGRLYDMERDTVRALTPAGEETWSTALDRLLYSVLERDGWVYVTSPDGGVRLDADTGVVRSEIDVDVLRPMTMGGPIYAGRFSVSAYDVEAGDLVARWSVDPEGPYEADAPLVGADGRLYRAERAWPGTGARTGRLSILDATDGSTRTTVPFEHTPGAPAVDGESVYVSTATVTADDLGSDGLFVALFRTDEERWRYEPGASLQPPVVADGTVYLCPFANDEVPLIAFDARTGEELWRRPIGGMPELAVAGETLYVAASGTVRALRRP